MEKIEGGKFLDAFWELDRAEDAFDAAKSKKTLVFPLPSPAPMERDNPEVLSASKKQKFTIASS